MGAKITALVLTGLVNLVVGAVLLLFLLVAMNGYSESDATPGLLVYVVLALLTAGVMGVASLMLVGFLAKRKYSGLTGGLISITIFSILGTGLILLSSLVGVGVAEYVRVNY